MKEDKRGGDEHSDLRRNIVIGIVSLIIYMVVISLLGFFLRDPVEKVCHSLIGWFGYMGLFISIFVMDAFMIPPAPDLIIFIAVAGDQQPALALLSMCSASILAGSLGFFLGSQLRKRGAFISRDNPKLKKGENIIKRYGIWAVAIGCLTPFPFTIVTWTAGFLGMRYRHFLPVTFLRIPRFVAYYYMFSLGWL